MAARRERLRALQEITHTRTISPHTGPLGSPALELLKGVAVRRHETVRAGKTVRGFGHVEVPTGVHTHRVRGAEVAWGARV